MTNTNATTSDSDNHDSEENEQDETRTSIAIPPWYVETNYALIGILGGLCIGLALGNLIPWSQNNPHAITAPLLFIGILGLYFYKIGQSRETFLSWEEQSTEKNNE